MGEVVEFNKFKSKRHHNQTISETTVVSGFIESANRLYMLIGIPNAGK